MKKPAENDAPGGTLAMWRYFLKPWTGKRKVSLVSWGSRTLKTGKLVVDGYEQLEMKVPDHAPQS